MDKENYYSTYLIKQTELKTGRYVYLNVYHITKFNYLLKIMGLGLFHTSIQIEDLEYSYGSTEDNLCGIYIHKINETNDNLILKGKFSIQKLSIKNYLNLFNL